MPGAATRAHRSSKKPKQDQPLRHRRRDTSRLEVEALLAVDLADGRGVRAADVVLLDVEIRHRVRVCPVAQHEVAVGLEGVGALAPRAASG